ncbi:Oidioi.mRNA.OKI2018_I69.PAR.g12872.t1.cds [Oikopleura dioica]|uniref:Oidioi.mRNA.OKI2018_I69.PAR.g12872.t1.cds n=1 Tax=Oikopleura dioica TaxID=34765 RepID=A0ABN7S8Z1_OIKDI|nr:Oidioi.mRNA.OKI2018_I69.PAR.g12872.t1.cds [Oikopleura dioica]
MEARSKNIQARDVYLQGTPLKPAALPSRNQLAFSSARSQEKTKEKVDPVENAVSQSFLDGEWERMNADPAIDFAKVRPDSRFAEISCPFPTTPAKKISPGILDIPNEQESSQEMSPPRDYKSFNLSDILDSP